MIFGGKRGKRGENKTERAVSGAAAAVRAGAVKAAVPKLILAAVLAFTMSFTTSMAFAATSVSPFTGTSYTHSSKLDDRIILNGIDVSAYQENIDWQAAKRAGVDFAIIRAGYRGYGAAGNMKEDSCFVKHIEAAKKAGIMVGVYFFSQALNTLEARAEAMYTLEILGSYELDLPIFMDYEFSPASSGRFTSGTITKYQATENVKAFCEYIKANGHEAGLYANLNFLNKTVDGAALGEIYPIWIAQYYNTCNYDYTYDYWQYSSSGAINGIPGRTDVNFLYLAREAVKSSDYSLTDASVQLNGSSYYSYSAGSVYEPSVSVYHNGRYLIPGVDYELHYIGNASAGTAYAMVSGKGAYTDYKLVSFEISPSRDLSGITIQKPKDRTYTGSVTKPSSITVTDTRSGQKLIENLDYTYRVENAVNVGEADLYVDFIGNYRGTKSVKYNIVKAPEPETPTVPTVPTDPTEPTEPTEPTVPTVPDGSEDTDTAAKNERIKAGVQNTRVVLLTAEEVSSKRIKLSWKKSNSGYGVDNYEIWRATGDSSEYTQLFNTTNKYYVNTKGLEPETSYSYQVRGVRTVDGELVYTPFTTINVTTAADENATDDRDDEADNKADEEAAAAEAAKNAKIKAGVEKTKVVSLKAPEVGSSRVKLSWKKSNSGYKVDTYQIWRSTKKSSGYKKIFTSSNATNKYYINTKGLKPNTTYWYKVRGVRTVGGELVYTPFTKIEVKTKK